MNCGRTAAADKTKADEQEKNEEYTVFMTV